VGLDTRTGVAEGVYAYAVPFKFMGKLDKLTFNLAPDGPDPKHAEAAGGAGRLAAAGPGAE